MNVTNVMALIGFGPAIVLLYFVLGKFEGYFKDHKALFMVAFGMVIGLFIGIFSIYLPIHEFIWALALIFLIELIKFFILLQKPFRLKHDATFYGMALGIGVAATMVFIYGYYAQLTELDARTIFFVFLLSYNYNLIHGSTGAIIGYGSYIGDFWGYLLKAFLISGGHGFLMTMVWSTPFDSETAEIRIFSLLIMGAVYATVLLLYVYHDIIPKTIPREMKKANKVLNE